MGRSPGERNGSPLQYSGLENSIACTVRRVAKSWTRPWTIAHQGLLSMGFPGQEYGSGLPFPPPGDLPNPGIEPTSLALQVDSLPAEPPGKPKNTRVGSLSLLQQIFPTQESTRGLLHCRRILYQLSYQGSPRLQEKRLQEEEH